MARELCTVENTTIPEGVTVSIKNRKVTVTGPRGTLVRDFAHAQYNMTIKGNTFGVTCYHGNQKERAGVKTISTHVQNMINGVTKGYRYTMRVCYRFFNPEIVIGKKGEFVEIIGFMHGSKVHHFDMPEGHTVRQDPEAKEQFILEGNSVEELGRVCSFIRQSCQLRDKDLRVFLDGIYVRYTGLME